MILSIAISVRLEAILNPLPVFTHVQYLGRIGAKFWALRELLEASWNFHTFKSLHVLSQQLAGVGNQHERLHCSLPFLGIVLRLRQLGDVERGVAERDQPFAE